jgi:hypothetical protein
MTQLELPAMFASSEVRGLFLFKAANHPYSPSAISGSLETAARHFVFF